MLSVPRQGKVELWDPWTGENTPIYAISTTDEGTRVRMPLEPYELSVIVFSPGEPECAVERSDLDEIVSVQKESRTHHGERTCSERGHKIGRCQIQRQDRSRSGHGTGQPAARRGDGTVGIRACADVGQLLGRFPATRIQRLHWG